MTSLCKLSRFFEQFKGGVVINFVGLGWKMESKCQCECEKNKRIN